MSLGSLTVLRFGNVHFASQEIMAIYPVLWYDTVQEFNVDWKDDFSA